MSLSALKDGASRKQTKQAHCKEETVMSQACARSWEKAVGAGGGDQSNTRLGPNPLETLPHIQETVNRCDCLPHPPHDQVWGISQGMRDWETNVSLRS